MTGKCEGAKRKSRERGGKERGGNLVKADADAASFTGLVHGWE